MENSWAPGKYKAKELEELLATKQIIIPSYQRGLVWPDSKKEKLIDSIKNGYPFGSILLYEDQKTKKLQLIDGLQRSYTIFDFVNHPSLYFNVDDIDDDAISRIYEVIGKEENENETEIKEKIKNILIQWLQNDHKTMNDVTSIQYISFSYKLAKEFKDRLSDANKMREIADIVKPMVNDYQDICRTLINAEIPALIFKGDEEILPEIFERINSQGAQLTKYQIFSATWNTINIKISDPTLKPILDYVCNRYDALTGGNFEIEGYNSTKIKHEKKINPFDLCYGFGKLLKKEYPYLFGSDDDSDKLKIDSVGFTLINSCLAYRFSDLKQLHTHLRNLGDDKVNKLLKNILSCAKEVNGYLKVLTAFKGNTRETKNVRINHTELQIASIIVSMFTTKYVALKFGDDGEIIDRTYDFDNVSSAWSTYKDAFAKNMKIAYVQDILGQKWTGSGDRKLENILKNRDYYRRDISYDEFAKNFDTWYIGIVLSRSEEKKVAIPKEADRVILNLIYANEFNAHDQLDNSKYDIEHLIPKKQLKNRLEKYNKDLDEELKIKLPISSIGNVCYLPENINRTKGSKTIYQADYSEAELSKIEEKYSFTKREDMAWLDQTDLDGRAFKKAFIDFLNKRNEIIKQKIKNILF